MQGEVNVKRDLLSIVIPVYNSEKYLAESIKSVLSQTYKDIEVIIINDGSIDNSAAIIETFRKKDKRIKHFTTENRGANKAREFGVKKATGKYIMFVDSDDALMENAAETVVNAFHCNVDIDSVKFKAQYMCSDKKVEDIQILRDFKVLTQKEKMKYILLSDKFSNLWSQAFVTDDIKRANVFCVKYSYCEDYLANFLIHRAIGDSILIDRILYKYRRNQNSTTRNKNPEKLLQNIKERISVCRIMLEKQPTNIGSDTLRVFRGFQIERIRRELCKIAISSECLAALKKTFKIICEEVFPNDDYAMIISTVTRKDICKYEDSLSLPKRIFYHKFYYAIYEKNTEKMWKYLLWYRKLKVGLKK